MVGSGKQLGLREAAGRRLRIRGARNQGGRRYGDRLTAPSRINRGEASPPEDGKEKTVDPALMFIASLALLAFAGRELAAAGRALGMPDGLVGLLESIALR